MKTIPFFSDKIKIAVTTASDENWLYGEPVSIRTFAGPCRVGLYELDNGELLVKRSDGAFIQGEEAL